MLRLIAIVAGLTVAAALPASASGQSRSFEDPRWRHAMSNQFRLVHACQSDTSDCRTAPEVRARADAWCSTSSILDRFGQLVYVRATERQGDEDSGALSRAVRWELTPTTSLSGPWVSYDGSAEPSTGEGGWVFGQIVCGTGADGDDSFGDEDVVTARVNVVRAWNRPKRAGVDQLISLQIRGSLEVSGELGAPRVIGFGRERRVLTGARGNPSGTLRLTQTYRRCLGASCGRTKTTRRATWLRPNAVSRGVASFVTPTGEGVGSDFVKVVAGSILRTEMPGCRAGAQNEKQLVMLLRARVVTRNGRTTRTPKVTVRACGRAFGVDVATRRAGGTLGFRVRERAEPPAG